MKLFTRIVALMLALLTALSLMGCHEKGEVVMTVDGVEITSGLYLAFQLDAYRTFCQKVAEANPDAGLQKFADCMTYLYQNQDATTYINAETQRLAKEYVVVQKKYEEYKDKGLVFDKARAQDAESYAKEQWETNGAKTTYEAHGVSYATYKTYVEHMFKRTDLFSYYYDKADKDGNGGLYTVPEDEVIPKLTENYTLAHTLSVTIETAEGAESPTDVEVTAAKTKVETYIQKYLDGTSFADIYKEETKQDLKENIDDKGSDVKTILPKDATIFYSQATDEQQDNALYQMIQDKMAEEGFEYAKPYLVGGEDDGRFCMIIVYDIASDPYYVDGARSEFLSDLRETDFTTKLNEEGAKLKVVTDSKLVAYYDPKNIDLDSLAENAQ